MSEIASLEKLFRDEVLEVPEAVNCFGPRLFNSVAQDKSRFPYAVFQVIPLSDKFGQARTSIQSRFFIDFKIYSRLPLPVTVDPAVAAVKELFRASRTFDAEGYRVSIRHERMISLLQKGLKSDEKILCRGGTYFISISVADV